MATYAGGDNRAMQSLSPKASVKERKAFELFKIMCKAINTPYFIGKDIAGDYCRSEIIRYKLNHKGKQCKKSE